MDIIEQFKHVVHLANRTENGELCRKLRFLQAEINQLVDQLKRREKAISCFQTALSMKGELTYKNSAYWVIDENGQITDGPFCRQCFDEEQIRTQLVRVDSPKRCRVMCPRCQIPFDSYPAWEFLSAQNQQREPIPE
jgi:hypothetical protein